LRLKKRKVRHLKRSKQIVTKTAREEGRILESESRRIKKKATITPGECDSLRLKYNELTEKFNTSKSSVERATIRNEREQIKNQMDDLRAQIGEVKETLDKKIPEEASLYGAKPEWVKP